MPELPEVQTTVKGLNKKVLNRAFIDVWSDWHKMARLRSASGQVKRPKSFDLFKKDLLGKKIKKVWRRAKNVIFELSSGYSLLIHQKMTGHLMVGKWVKTQEKWKPKDRGPLDEKINTYLHLMLFLDNGQMIALSDLRKFAKVELWKTEELLNSKEFLSLGPEPLEKGFNFKKFKERLLGKRGKIKIILMNPEIIAGIGNIYANEALWWSKIHPEKDVSRLSEKELRLLYNAVIKVLEAGVRLGGESFSDYRNVEGEKGHFDTERKAYKREKQKCQRCETLIKRIKFNGRSSFFCPSCQTL